MKKTVYLTDDVVLLLPHVREPGESMSRLVQRLVTEAAALKGIKVEKRMTFS